MADGRMELEEDPILDDERNSQRYNVLSGALNTALDERGIDTVEEWENYLSKTEADGEIITDLCQILNTGTLQIREAIENMREDLEKARREHASDDEDNIDWTSVCASLSATLDPDERSSTNHGGSGSVPILSAITDMHRPWRVQRTEK
ncbi:unnamed protein product [Heligmosomoides polygyrus]|uniref:Tail assembly chaperone n=1 Tax=Heligmosomoides polygyrus TaxID=6339 RepID=A0A183G2W5_HELPZ|nr:unnamed protein product [Heligmosomoides polygyrus]